jgi:hypothetical protein
MFPPAAFWLTNLNKAGAVRNADHAVVVAENARLRELRQADGVMPAEPVVVLRLVDGPGAAGA